MASFKPTQLPSECEHTIVKFAKAFTIWYCNTHCTHIHMYTCTHTHTLVYTHTHTHTHIQTKVVRRHQVNIGLVA